VHCDSWTMHKNLVALNLCHLRTGINQEDPPVIDQQARCLDVVTNLQREVPYATHLVNDVVVQLAKDNTSKEMFVLTCRQRDGSSFNISTDRNSEISLITRRTGVRDYTLDTRSNGTLPNMDGSSQMLVFDRAR
jgi:hypothetical protein